MFKLIPTKIHGILDYVVGIALILAPYIFQFSSVGGAAVWVPQVIGIVLILYSLITKYEWSIVKLIPMPYHLTIDMLASIFLALSPFLFGFNNQSGNVWLPHVIVGIVVIIVVLLSQTKPGNMSKPMNAAPSAPAAV
jgi:hypothetical protein